MSQNSRFPNGSQWVRLDCHLHTKADKEFKYSEHENEYIAKYVEKLKSEKIDVGIITNHNKFDIEEFKALKKKANKENIFLLAGVELSVNDGANGIHALVVFNPDVWIENGNNYIGQFITESFARKANYENENGRSNYDLITTIEKLNKYNRDYFIILAHVEAKSGFFEEFEGGRIQELAKNALFQKRVIAFQKVTRYDLSVWNQWFNSSLPAFVEGSDPKKIEEIGKGEKSYIKIGDYNFEAVKFALQNKEFRVSQSKPKIQNAYLKSISFDGGKLDKQSIEFSGVMNNFVGIRGSGKSSIIEALRYTLNLPYGNNRADSNYKDALVKNLFGSAGKAVVKVCDRKGNEFTVERVFGHSMQIKREDEELNLNINSILNNPIYFGQKDLSNYKDNFEQELIDKLIGDKTHGIKDRIEDKKLEIKIELEKLRKYDTLEEKKEQVEQKITELNLKLEEFKKHNIDEKLKKQIEFNKDKSQFNSIQKQLVEFGNDVNEFLEKYKQEDFFKNLKRHQSKENGLIFDKLYQIIDRAYESFLELEGGVDKLFDSFKSIHELEKELSQEYQKLQEEFLQIQRAINLPNLRADDFITFTKALDTQNLMMYEINKYFLNKKEVEGRANKKLDELNELYCDEYRIIENEIQKINDAQKPIIEIKAEFKGDKISFEEYLKALLSGSGLSAKDYNQLSQYADGVEIYKNIEQIEFGGNKRLNFREKFMASLSPFLTYQVPNKIEILYNGKELRKHSLGQRASALILFILTQKDNDVIIIDQPEDDLDNQTIYNEVIKELLKLKNQTQFIFATHNANIPVLGDCEQVIVCDYDEDKINVEMGSINNHDIQEKIINIMEGGKEAFSKRKEIYNLWKH